MRKKITANTLVLLVIILLAFAYFGWHNSPQKLLGVDLGTTTKADQTVPFAVAKNASTQHFNENGELNYTFFATKIEHYTDETLGENYTLIYAPTIVVFQDGEPWYVDAQQGKISQNGDLIELWKDVTIMQTLNGGDTTQLLTQTLTIEPKAKRALTDDNVTITSAKGTLTGTGLIANFAQSTLTLLANVRGIHDPL